MDPLLLTLINERITFLESSPTTPKTTLNYPISEREELFINFLTDNQWLNVPSPRLLEVIEHWKSYVTSKGKDSMTSYSALVDHLEEVFPELPKWLLNYTTLLHRTCYLEKHGFIDSIDLDRNSGSDIRKYTT